MDAPAIAQHAAALIRAGQYAEAESLLAHAITTHPADASLRIALCAALHRLGRIDGVPPHARAVIAAPPDDNHLIRQLAIILRAAGHGALAIEALRARADSARADPDAWAMLAEGLFAEDRFVPAVEAARRGLALRPHDKDLSHWLALALRECGLVAEAVAVFRDQLARDPRDFNLASRLCYALNSIDAEPSEVLDAHRGYGRILGSLAPPHSPFRPASLPRSGPLRVGILSSDLRGHSVGSFLGPLIEHLDRRLFRVACFSTGPFDDTSARLKRTADAWFDCSLDDPAALGHAITADDTHILLELSGHTMGCALPLLALRVAPIQATYLGYPNTTGTPNVDFRIVDSLTDPPGAEQFATERLIRLDPCFLCYTPPAAAPPTSLAVAHRPLTFASFNALRKISPQAINAWAAILRAAPGSRLLLKAAGLHDAPTAQRFRNELASRGVNPACIDCRPWRDSRTDHLSAYHEADIALDTYPYHGTTTTCEALFMGVPVVTLAGNTHAARVGVSLLSAVGLPELIARTPDDYIAIALKLAADTPRRAELRASLRSRLLASPLCDAHAFALRFEHVLLSMHALSLGNSSP